MQIWKARHAIVSHANPEQISLVAEVCQSFALDNGAFTIWKSGGKIDTGAYRAWVEEWSQHPGFDWALIPDVIDGSESQNDKLLGRFLNGCHIKWVPVWHLHESVKRLDYLAQNYPRVAFGSSGDYSEPGTDHWWNRMSEAMEVVCDNKGRPITKLHGLRMMDPTIFSHIPFASVDSTNVARNISIDKAWTGSYRPLTDRMRGLVLVERIESHASANRWTNSCGIQKNFELVG